MQSPVSDQRVSGLGPTTFTASAASAQFASVPLQYRFQLFNDAGTLVQDSALLNNPSWTMTTTLTPLKRYTWKVRAEYQGTAGPWSADRVVPDPGATAGISGSDRQLAKLRLNHEKTGPGHLRLERGRVPPTRSAISKSPSAWRGCCAAKAPGC